jgi:uncharacterized protein YggE
VVAGEATRSHSAERGTVHLEVSLTGDDRTLVSAATIEAHNEIVAEASAQESLGSVTAWSADRVSTEEFQEYPPGGSEPIRRFRARTTVEVTFVDFTALADWVSALGGREGVHVRALDWTLTAETRERLERDARIAAVRDAVTKAADYASALDLGTPDLDAVYEEGLRPGLGGGTVPGFARAAMMKSAAQEGASFELSPRDIDVSATISADFTLELPRS